MSSNLLKGHLFEQKNKGNEKRIIDSNALVNKRLAELAEKIEQEALDEDFLDGFTTGIKAENVTDLLQSPEEELEEGEILTLEEANQKAIEIVEDARKQAEVVLQDSIEKAEASKEAIFEKAKEEGYAKGQQMAVVRLEEKEREMSEKLLQMEREYREKEEKLEMILVDTITDVYSHVFSVALDDYRGILIKLIEDTLHGVGGSKEILVKVSGEDFNFVNSKKRKLMEFLPSSGISLEILEDSSLGRQQCLVVTENGIFDCGIDTQLEMLRKKLVLLSYRKESLDK